jgi:hypothetical protein
VLYLVPLRLLLTAGALLSGIALARLGFRGNPEVLNPEDKLHKTKKECMNMISQSRQSHIVMIVLVLGGLVFATGATAMTLKEIGDQLILSGPVVDGDAEKVRETLARNPIIRTVVLRNSPGGYLPPGYAVGDLMREKGLRTAVSGYCYSGCSRMFLGGKERVFTDDYPLSLTHVGFHGHYYTSGTRNGQLNIQLVRSKGLKDWIIRHSDGRADPDLVERWINIPVSIGMIHFFHPQLAQRQKAATFFCEHGPMPGIGVLGCEPIAKNALDLGIVTSLEMIKSNDQEELRASFPKIPPKTDYARIDEMDKVPLGSEKGLAEYKRYLQAVPPKAFAIAPDKSAWAWQSGNVEAINLALSRCSERSRKPCLLYAVDDDIVWKPTTPNT